MKPPLPMPGVEWAVLGFSGWQAADLRIAWRHSPLDRLGWLALGIWLTPLLARFLRRCADHQPPSARVPLCWLALAFGLLGLLTEMHFTQHCALACACAALTPSFRLWGLWFGLSLAWMPALGWILAGFSPSGLVVTRLALASGAAAIALAGAPCFHRRSLA